MKVSVVIPVKNGAHTLERCLRSIRSQTIKNVEIIILDSASTDNSKAIAHQYQAIVIPIPENTFDHGLTRNIGYQRATGDLVFLTVQDAWIAEKDMLEKMARHFADENIMAVTGHQATPHEADKNPLRWYRRFSEPRVEIRVLNDINAFDTMGHKEQQSLIAWDNVVAMYRKEALQQLPFVATEMSEDWVWSRDALLKGWSLVYDPSLVIYHYHHETYRYVYQLSYSVNYHFYKYFGFVPDMPAFFSFIARATWHLAKHKELSFSKKIYWIFYNYESRIAKMLSYLNFLFYLKTGGLKGLDKRYTAVCKTIPQGKQNRVNE